jgi:hypothetical protein
MNELTEGEDWQLLVVFFRTFSYWSAGTSLCRRRPPIFYFCFFVFPWLAIVAYLLIRVGKFARPHEVREQPGGRLVSHPRVVLHKTAWVRAKSSTFSRSTQRYSDSLLKSNSLLPGTHLLCIRKSAYSTTGGSIAGLLSVSNLANFPSSKSVHSVRVNLPMGAR